MFNPIEKRKIIMNNYLKPSMKKEVVEKNDNTFVASHCSDKLILDIELKDNKITKAFFDGHGCAVFISSTNILLKQILNKDSDFTYQLLINYKNMLQNMFYEKKILGDLIVFEDISKQMNRLNCALLIEKSLNKILF